MLLFESSGFNDCLSLYSYKLEGRKSFLPTKHFFTYCIKVGKLRIAICESQIMTLILKQFNKQFVSIVIYSNAKL